MDSAIRWAYALGPWKTRINTFVRVGDHERAFKTLSALGFHAVELRAGSGRWDNLGRPELIAMSYGSVDGFAHTLASFGSKVASLFWDPSMPAEEDGWEFRLATNPGDHDAIVAAATPFIEFLSQVGGSTLIVRPTAPAWMIGTLNDTSIQTVAALWNRVGAVAQTFGITTALHLDALSPIRGEGPIETLLAATDPALVGLAIDTAELTIAGVDPLALYEKHADRVVHVHLSNTRFTDDTDDYLLPHADVQMMRGGGGRGIERWFTDLADDAGLVDVAAFVTLLDNHRYSSWVVVETEQAGNPGETAMINSWFVQKRLGVALR